MKTKISSITRLALTGVTLLCLSASVLAGPSMFMMYHGKMMMVTPMTKDMKLKSGCKVCMNGAVISSTGTTMSLKDGDMVSAEGVMMPPSPPSRHAHGG